MYGRRAESFNDSLAALADPRARPPPGPPASPPPSPPAPPPPSALRRAALDWFDEPSALRRAALDWLDEFQWQMMVNHGDLGLISSRLPAVNGGGGGTTASSVASSSSAIAHTRVAPYPFSPSPPPSPPEASSSANPAQFGSSKVKPSVSTEKLQSSFVGPAQGDSKLASPQDTNLASPQDGLFSRAVAVAMPTSCSRGTLPQLPAPPTQLMLDVKGRGKEGAVSGSGGSLTSTPKREADLAENSTSLAENSQKKKGKLMSFGNEADLAENSTSLAENSQKKKGKLMSFGKSLFIPSSTSTEIPSGPSSSRRPSSEHFSESEIVPFSASAALQKFIEKHGAYPMVAADGLGWPRMASDSLGRLLINHRESH